MSTGDPSGSTMSASEAAAAHQAGLQPGLQAGPQAGLQAGPQAGLQAGPQIGSAEHCVAFRTPGQRSAPASPCVPRRALHPQTLNLDSKIPQPLASPTSLRRTGSLRLRGEKLALGHMRAAHGGPRPARSPGTTFPFPSITEASELWKKSLRRGSEDGPLANFATTPVGPGSSCLRHERHHRSLQSLLSRHVSKDSYPHTPTPSPEDLDQLPSQNFNRFLLDHAREFSGDRDDLDSLRSFGSNCSTQSACDHSQFGRNGTTFSGRRMKYIVHCSSHPEPNEYLTPTQRANQQIRRLKALVDQARKDMEAKDESIFKLTKEVVELRLLRDEVDGTHSKTSKKNDDSSVCKVVTSLENENGNSTSLSDSGHFDDILSLTPAQSSHSPSLRCFTSTPESERMSEMYQRRIEEVSRKHGEKGLEDRKCLVEMYEKKMEDMSRKSNEKFQIEKNNLIEMYEKKIEGIVKKQLEKVQEEKLQIQGSYQKKINTLSEKLEDMKVLHEAQHDTSMQASCSKLKEAESHITSLKQQSDEMVLRLNDLQHELFQEREKVVTLEEEVETLQKTIATQDKELSDMQEAVVQTATLESELHVLRMHIEEQRETSELISKLRNELVTAQNRLKEEECRSNELERENLKIQVLCDEKEKNVEVIKSQFEADLARVSELLLKEKRKNEELQNKEVLLEQKLKESMELHFQLESKLNASLEREDQARKELEVSKAQLLSFNEEQRQSTSLKSDLEHELDKVKDALFTVDLENKELKRKYLELEAFKHEELQHYLKINSQLERDVTSLRLDVSEKEQRIREGESWKLAAKNLEQGTAKYVLELENFSLDAERLQNEIVELKRELEKEKKGNLHIQDRDRDFEEFKELLNRSQEETEERIQQVHNLTEQIRKLEGKTKSLSKLLSEEIHKNEDLLQWKSKTEALQSSLNVLREEIYSKNKLLECFSETQDEVLKLKQSLARESERVGELLHWKSKAETLEEELKSLIKGSAINETVSPSKFNVVNGMPKILNLETVDVDDTQKCDETQERIFQLESEVEELKENLDQAYWAQSEKETLKLELEKVVTEQTQNLQVLGNEVLALNELISTLKEENDELRSTKHVLQDKVSSPENLTICMRGSEMLSLNKGDDECIELNGDTSGGSKLLVSKLKAEIESVTKALADQEDRHAEMNLKMYLKGKEAAKFERKDQVLEMATQAPEKVSIPELLTQLAETENELEKVKAMYRQLAEGQANNSSSPEATLLFLKSAFYYFLTDEANCQGHLHAIQSILGFTESERQSIDTLTYFRR